MSRTFLIRTPMKKTTPRLHTLSIFGGFALFFSALFHSSASAATYTVTKTADSGPGSLRQAVSDANATPADDTINFAIPASDPGCLDGVCTITLTTGELLVVEKATGGALTITHPNPEELRISGNNASRVLTNGGKLTLNGVTITGGKASESFGGGINHSGEAMTLTNSIVTGNTANIGGGILCGQTSMTISNSRVTGNVASGGAGFYTLRGNVVISNSVISDNTAVPPSPNSSSEGGGVTNNQGSVTIEDTTISGNSAVFGAGGVQNLAGVMTIRRSTISGNMVSNTNPAVFTAGGGIVSAQSGNQSASLTMINSTISGNKAGRGGGGLFNQGRSSVLLLNCTVTGNETVSTNTSFGGGGGISVTFETGSEVRSKNSLIAGNIAGNGNGPDLATNGGTGFITLGYNLIGNTSGTTITWAASDKINVAPQIGSLGANGGPTATHALEANSPAVNMGDNCVFAATCSDLGTVPVVSIDQRSAPRAGTAANPVDIGAYEFGAEPPNPIPIPVLWGAGRDLLSHEKPNNSNETNPVNAKVPQWKYGSRATAAGTALTLFTPAQHVNAASGLDGWIASGQATLGVNTKTTPIIFNTGSGDYLPLLPTQMYLSPGSANDFLVARFTAPATGVYRVMARWVDLDNHGGNGATAYVIKNGQELFSQSFESTVARTGRAWMRSRDLTLASGDTLDFVVGSNGEHTFDATAFNAAVRRIPQVLITLPAPSTEFTGAQDVTFNVELDDTQPGTKVRLTVDEAANVATDLSAPFSLTARLQPGYHKITAVATGADGAKAESPQIVVIVAPSAASQPARKGSAASEAAAASPPGLLFRSAGSGSWHNPSTWGSTLAPGRWDHVIIQPGHNVSLDFGIQVRHLTVNGRVGASSSATVQPSLDVYGTLHATGQIDHLDLYINGPAGKFLILGQSPILRSVNLINQSTCVITADSFNGENVVIENRGSIQAGPSQISQGPLQVPAVSFNQLGGLTTLGPNTILRAPGGATIGGGALQLAPGQMNPNGTGFVGLDGGTLIGLDSSTLIGNDGSTLLGPDGAPLIGNDGSTLIGNDGSTIQPARAGSAAAPAAGEILLTGGTISGIGDLRGAVLNQGAFIDPGTPLGRIFVDGNFTQSANGTLVLEVGGAGPSQFDQLQISGTANLGGRLVVRTLNDFVPQAGDIFNPLTYGAANGTFASVTSNAQVSFGPAGMSLQVNGANPPLPKALNIATRMRVETGANVLIAGFIVTGAQPKKVLIRGIGPSLPLSGALADPVLRVDGGAIVNDDWRSSQESEIIETTVPPSNDRESAIVATLSPGGHTAILEGKNGGTGVGLVEVYDLEPGTPIRLANISSRGFVRTGDDVMIGGFIVGGMYPAKLIIRAIGPSLAARGVTGALQDTTLELFDSNGNSIRNDNWRETQEAEVIASTVPPSDDRESAIVATFVPGNYTAIVRGRDDTIGVALVEGYLLE